MPRIVQFDAQGGSDVLRLADIDLKAPAANEVRIEVKAFGVQRADILWREGQYVQSPDKFPTGLGYDCVGVIDAVGDNVSDFSVGDKVLTFPAFSLNEYSVYGESVVIHKDFVTKLPDAPLSWAECAAIAVPFYTGYFPLFEIADVRKAKFILVTAASSSTGIAAIQMAKAEGAKVIATTRTQEKIDQLKLLGADYVVTTENNNVVDAILKLTGERGVDIIYDPIGGALIESWYQVIKTGGYIFHYGLMDMTSPQIPLMLSVMKAVTFKSYMIFEFTGNESLGLPMQSEAVARAHHYIRRNIDTGTIRPVVAKSFALDDVHLSHDYMASNQQVGKIVVTV